MKDDRLYVGHIREAAERIVLYGRDGESRLRTDLRTQDAVIRNLQVMGEPRGTAKGIPGLTGQSADRRAW
jgi:uncharacterized protein with HEPN domain